jgi:hypothetical protein
MPCLVRLIKRDREAAQVSAPGEPHSRVGARNPRFGGAARRARQVPGVQQDQENKIKKRSEALMKTVAALLHHQIAIKLYS